MSDTINVKKRNETGTLRMRRLRKSGHIPAVLYGHGEGCVNLSAPVNEVGRVVEAGNQIIKLSGDETGSALIREVQWDAFGTSVLHLDLNRIEANEKVEVTINLETHGEAPGTKQGGIVQLILHEVTLLCPANLVPDNIEVDINHLGIDGVIKVSDLSIPDGAEMLTHEEDTVAVCAEPTAQPAEDEEGDAAEPEVIGDDEASNE